MKKKILIIDDEETIRFTIRIILSKEGCEVSTANGYYEALDIMAKRDFDLIFTDVMLEGKTGLDILREAKKQNSACPVVLFTGYPNIESESEAFRLGAYDYIPKPVTKDKLLHIVNTILHT
ncbi:MAG: response regulator [Candidatus Scalindua sediminis]|nr:response regulator [Candidatus Scalindua sediminis]HDY66626.1 response regulator [Candidatus Scalindua sp.]